MDLLHNADSKVKCNKVAKVMGPKIDPKVNLQKLGIYLAIESSEEMINKKILAKIDYQSPTERQRAFERAIG